MFMRRRSLLAGTAALLVPGTHGMAAGPNEIVGAGGNTIRPIMTNWIETQGKSLNLNVTYQAIGSPAGTSKLLAKDVDFAVLEIPISAEQLELANLFQFPLAFAAIVFVVNIPGVVTNQLALSGQLLGAIYWGSIKKWNDPKIVAANPGLTLPDLDIRVFSHGDAQGTVFGDTMGVTSYLLAANPDWREKFGTNVPKRWAVGAMSATGETMTNTIQSVEGAIGYLPLGAAVNSKLPIVLKRDNNAKNVTADAASLKAAVGAIDYAKPPYKIVDLPGDGVWPVVIASYGVLPMDMKAKPNGAALHSFFKFILTDGAEISRKRGGEPLPDAIRARILTQLDKFLA